MTIPLLQVALISNIWTSLCPSWIPIRLLYFLLQYYFCVEIFITFPFISVYAGVYFDFGCREAAGSEAWQRVSMFIEVYFALKDFFFFFEKPDNCFRLKRSFQSLYWRLKINQVTEAERQLWISTQIRAANFFYRFGGLKVWSFYTLEIRPAIHITCQITSLP